MWRHYVPAQATRPTRAAASAPRAISSRWPRRRQRPGRCAGRGPGSAARTADAASSAGASPAAERGARGGPPCWPRAGPGRPVAVRRRGGPRRAEARGRLQGARRPAAQASGGPPPRWNDRDRRDRLGDPVRRAGAAAAYRLPVQVPRAQRRCSRPSWRTASSACVALARSPAPDLRLRRRRRAAGREVGAWRSGGAGRGGVPGARAGVPRNDDDLRHSGKEASRK